VQEGSAHWRLVELGQAAAFLLGIRLSAFFEWGRSKDGGNRCKRNTIFYGGGCAPELQAAAQRGTHLTSGLLLPPVGQRGRAF